MTSTDFGYPPGTTVSVRQTMVRLATSIHAEVVGVVEAWEDLPTGSWYAHGKKDKLWLKRLKLRKADGELALLVVDNSTEIAQVQTQTSDLGG